MPTYEYACANCGNAWEEIQKITAPATDVCPKCHQATAKRQISGGNFILKGGGWYADLYSSPKGGSKTEVSSKPEGTNASSSSSSSPSSASESKGSGESKKESTAPAAAPSGSTGPAKSAAQ